MVSEFIETVGIRTEKRAKTERIVQSPLVDHFSAVVCLRVVVEICGCERSVSDASGSHLYFGVVLFTEWSAGVIHGLCNEEPFPLA